MTAEVLVDALPYFDQGYDDPGVRETSLAMVEEECRRYRPTKNYLEHLPSVNTTAFETEMMSNELDRIQNRLPMEPLSMKRYELLPPPPNKISEFSSWQESVENSMAQLEHQAVRAMNLDLMLEFGCETWKVYLDIIAAMQVKAQAQLQDIKKEIQDLNWQRKSKQTLAGEKLRALEAQWVMLVSKNYEIEQVCAKLEEKIAAYKQSNGQENGYHEEIQNEVDEAEEENENETETETKELNEENVENGGESTTDEEVDSPDDEMNQE